MDPQSYYTQQPVMQVYGIEIPTRCFVGGLPYSMTELELNTFFSQFGVVKDSKIITDRNGVSKGYGFVTYETEQEAADVCARGSLYYKEKKLNISKAIRRQGGQYSKANQEYVNGQRLLYQSAEGYLLAQKNGSWVMEEPSPFCQPAKPCFQLVSPPPVFVSGGHSATTTYLQSPVSAVTPTYYQALPAAPPMTHLPPHPDPVPLALYCDLVELPTPLLAPPLPPPPPHSHPPHLPPPPQQIKSHRDDHIFLGPDSTTSPQKELTLAVADTTEPECEEKREERGTVTEDSRDSSPSVVSSTVTSTSVSSLALEVVEKCALGPEEVTEEEEGEKETEKREGTGENAPSQSRPVKTRPPNLPYLPPPHHQPESAYPHHPQNYFTLPTVHQCTS